MPHTPGPWTWKKKRQWWELQGPDGARIADDGSACDEYSRAIDPEGNETDQANARLIAAAPDLLAACKALLEDGIGAYADAEGFALLSSSDDDQTCKALALARAAIAKAE